MARLTATDTGSHRGSSKQRPLPPLPPNAALRWDTVSRLLPEKPGEVLEIGCGRGGAASRIVRRATRMVAVEPDPQSFAVARRNLGSAVELHNCMSYELPGDPQFDTVCAFEVLEHIEDDAGSLQEWKAKIRPGGTIMISVPAWADRYGPFDEFVGHIRRYDPAHLRTRLEEAGFVDVHVEAYGFPVGNLLEAARNVIGRRRLAAESRATDFDERTAGSGRLLQPEHGLFGTFITLAGRPMVWTQRLFKGRGVGLVARARKPA